MVFATLQATVTLVTPQAIESFEAFPARHVSVKREIVRQRNPDCRSNRSVHNAFRRMTLRPADIKNTLPAEAFMENDIFARILKKINTIFDCETL